MAAPAELVRKIRRIEITTRRAVLDTLAGGYHSVFKGRGMAFSEVRPYQPGDEIRAIDWNVTARIGEPFVKVFVEERELTALIAVDRSASQEAGLSPQAKAEVAAEIAALLVFSALENGDRAGLLLFTDRVERFVPPRRGTKHGLRLISEALAYEPRGRGTDVALALRDITRRLRRRAVVFVVSDFLAAAAAAQPAGSPAATPAHPFTVAVKVDRDDVTLGEPFLVTVRIEHAPLDVYALPEPLGVDPLSLRGSPSISRVAKGDRAQTTFELPLVNLKTLEPRLPPLRLRVDGPEGERELEVPETPIRMRSLVAEEHAPDAE